MTKYQKWYWLAALVAAWLFDFLFWQKPAGISFTIWVLVMVAAGYILTAIEKKKPHGLSILLTVVIMGFALVMALRSEPFTRAVSVLLTFGGMILLTATFLNGYWPWYRLRDYFLEMLKVIGGGFSGAILLNSRSKTPPPVDATGKPSALRRSLPVIRGVLIALPIVAVLGVLLASADPIFGDWIKKVFDLEKIPEYLFRLFYILIIAAFLVGVYLRAIHPSGDVEKPSPDAPAIKPFLGWTETGIILGAVDLLFLVFVFIQVRYLFGGQANITETGYTYAEYARRGFGELVAVAILSLGLYVVLSSITRMISRAAKVGFSVLSVLLMANVMVILASSLQRILLYEDAYGFSKLRTYTNIGIYWLAALIVVVVLLELLKKRGRFGLALMITLVGFGATLALVNVDGFIVNRNVERARAGEELDVAYLNTLSSDAVPSLIRFYKDETLSADVARQVGAALACRIKVTNDPAQLPWQGYNFSEARAYRLLQENAASWGEYRLKEAYPGWVVEFNGEQIPCEDFSLSEMD